MKKTAKELDALIGGWLEEHKQKRLLDEKRKEEQDFIIKIIISKLHSKNLLYTPCFTH